MKAFFQKWWDTIKAEESAVGKFLINVVGKLGAACVLIGASAEQSSLLPPDWVPAWLKYTIAASTVAGYVIGKHTKKAD